MHLELNPGSTLLGGEPTAQERMVLLPAVRAFDLLHVARQPRVAFFAVFVSVLGATQVRWSLGFAIFEQTHLPLGGLLVAVGTIGQLGEQVASRGLQHLHEGLLDGSAASLREHMGLAPQRLHHHLRYGLLRSHGLLLILGRELPSAMFARRLASPPEHRYTRDQPIRTPGNGLRRSLPQRHRPRGDRAAGTVCAHGLSLHFGCQATPISASSSSWCQNSCDMPSSRSTSRAE